MNDVALTIRMPRPLHAQLKRLAQEDGRSMSRYLIELLKRQVCRFGKALPHAPKH